MKKTRFLSLALTGTLCVSLLAGCGGSGDGGGAAQTPDAANTSAVQENTGSAFKLGGTPSDWRRRHLWPGCPARRPDRRG